MPNYISTIGVHLYYAVEKTTGTRPTAKSDYKELIGIKSIPSMNPAPDSLDTTTLNEEEYKTSIPGLKDLGGSLSFTFNMSEELKTMWEQLITENDAAKTSGKGIWFFVDVPGLIEGLFFKGEPSSMGLPEMGVNSVMEVENSITPTAEPEWNTKPTAA